MSVAQGSRLSCRRKIIIEKHMDRYYSFLLSSFCGVYLRHGEVGGSVCGASLELQMGKTRQKYIHRKNFSNFTSSLNQITPDPHNFHFRSLQTLCIQNLSNCCWNNYDASISRVFLKFFFGRVFPHLVQLCAWGEKRLDVCRQRRLSLFVSDFYVCMYCRIPIIQYILLHVICLECIVYTFQPCGEFISVCESLLCV